MNTKNWTTRTGVAVRGLFGAAILAACGMAGAAVVSVSAYTNSISGGSPASTGVSLVAGESFAVSVDPAQLWNFSGGEAFATTNADGSTYYFIATNPDGTTFLGHIGSLIGQIDSGLPDAGDYFQLGTTFAGVATSSGVLNLFYGDSDFSNNSGAVQASISVVPEPSAALLLLAGLGAIGAMRRRHA